jgi:hypothetical protein
MIAPLIFIVIVMGLPFLWARLLNGHWGYRDSESDNT